MFEAKIYIVWKSSKGNKKIYAIFNSKPVAEYNAAIWKKESETWSPDFTINFRVEEQTIYGESYPVICVW